MVATTTEKPFKTGGDDLDDGLELDPDLLAPSDDEGSASGSEHGDERLDGEESDREDDPDASFAPLEGEEDEIVKSPIAEGKKRKVEEVDEEEVEAGEEDDSEDAKQAEKKRRKKEKEKERKAKKRQNAIDPSSTNNAPTHLPTADISSILLKSIRESFPSASAVELEDRVIPTDHILPPPNYPSPQEDEGSSSSFKALQARVESLLKPLEKKKLVNGTPQIIILSLSGLRCADVVRGVRDVKGKGEVAKLFAKHFKTADQVKYLEKTKVTIAVGTPSRVGKLLLEGAIRITKDTVLLLDIAHQDSKTRTILTLPEVRDELWKSVLGGPARETLLNGGVRIGAF